MVQDIKPGGGLETNPEEEKIVCVPLCSLPQASGSIQLSGQPPCCAVCKTI